MDDDDVVEDDQHHWLNHLHNMLLIQHKIIDLVVVVAEIGQ